MANFAESFEVTADATLVYRLQWSEGSGTDVDLQAVVVDNMGRIVDAAYYNNMKACGGKALTHSGDESGGKGRTNQEEVRVTLGKMPSSVRMVLVVACCFNGTAIKDAGNATLSLEQMAPSRTSRGSLNLVASSSGLLVASLKRKDSDNSSSAWVSTPLQKAMHGCHFMDCLDGINEYIASVIPGTNRRQKVAFAMDKGDVVEFGTSLTSITLGLGWDVDKGEIDLDASAVLLDESGTVLESIFFGNLQTSKSHSKPGAVRHSGDNLTGAGDGDDERIYVQLESLGPTVHNVFFCIHVYSKGRGGRPKTFSCVAAPYCRVVEGCNEQEGEELCRFTLTEAGNESGLIIARLLRGADGRWGFHALGAPSGGTMYKDAFPEIQRLAKMNVHEMQRSSTKLFKETAAAPMPAPAAVRGTATTAASPPEPTCCVLQ